MVTSGRLVHVTGKQTYCLRSKIGFHGFRTETYSDSRSLEPTALWVSMLCTPTAHISITLLPQAFTGSSFLVRLCRCSIIILPALVSWSIGFVLEMHRHSPSLHACQAAFKNDLVLIIFVFMCVHTCVQCPWRREEDVGFLELES